MCVCSVCSVYVYSVCVSITQCVYDPCAQTDAQEHEGPAAESQSPGLHVVELMFSSEQLLQEHEHKRERQACSGSSL